MSPKETVKEVPQSPLTPEMIAILQEIKKPYVDPVVEANKLKQREQMRRTVQEGEEDKRIRQANCSHMRDDNTSRIAWYTFSDGVERGFCQLCNKKYDAVENRTDYIAARRVPTRSAGVVG